MKCRHLFTLFALAVTMGAAHAEPADDAKVLSAMEQAWATASQTADQPVLNAILDDSFSQKLPDGRQRTKAQLLQAPRLPAGSRQELLRMDEKVNGDTAVVTGVVRYYASVGAQPLELSFLDVFARRDGTWRAISSELSHP